MPTRSMQWLISKSAPKVPSQHRRSGNLVWAGGGGVGWPVQVAHGVAVWRGWVGGWVAWWAWGIPPHPTCPIPAQPTPALLPNGRHSGRIHPISNPKSPSKNFVQIFLFSFSKQMSKKHPLLKIGLKIGLIIGFAIRMGLKLDEKIGF